MGDRRERETPRKTHLALDLGSLEREPSNHSASDLTGVEEDTEVTPAILEDIKATFHLFDQDDSGTIDPKEIRSQMRGLGFEADNTTIYTFINDLDSDGSQTLEFEEFCSLMKDHLRIHEPSYNARENISEIFDFMDDPDPTKRNGRIDASCLRFIANALGDNLTEEELEAMLQGADHSGKGYVDAEDFYQLMVRGSERPVAQRSRRNNILPYEGLTPVGLLRRTSKTRKSTGNLEGRRRDSILAERPNRGSARAPKISRARRESRIPTSGVPKSTESAGRPTSSKSLASLASCSSEGSVQAASALMAATLSPTPSGEDVPPDDPT